MQLLGLNCDWVGPGVGMVYLLNRASDGLELGLAHDGSVLEVARRAGPVLSGCVGAAR